VPDHWGCDVARGVEEGVGVMGQGQATQSNSISGYRGIDASFQSSCEIMVAIVKLW